MKPKQLETQKLSQKFKEMAKGKLKEHILRQRRKQNSVHFSDATLRDGQVKLVNYWASWCAPCRAEHPNLEKLAQEGIPVYGINYKDKLANADAFLSELGDPYAAIGRDENGRMGLDWGVYGVPETYVIDGDGTIILRFAGPITQRVIESTIRPALEKAAAQ